jgi:hypothetical protein
MPLSNPGYVRKRFLLTMNYGKRAGRAQYPGRQRRNDGFEEPPVWSN